MENLEVEALIAIAKAHDIIGFRIWWDGALYANIRSHSPALKECILEVGVYDSFGCHVKVNDYSIGHFRPVDIAVDSVAPSSSLYGLRSISRKLFAIASLGNVIVYPPNECSRTLIYKGEGPESILIARDLNRGPCNEQ